MLLKQTKLVNNPMAALMLITSSSSFISLSWREKCFPGVWRHFVAFLHEGLIKEG